MITIFLAKYLVFAYPLFMGYLLLHKEVRQAVLIAIAGLIAKALAVITGYFIFIPRPFVINPALLHYAQVASSGLINDSSFFSAHAATSFAAATVIYLDNKSGKSRTGGIGEKLIGVVALFIAALVAFGRVLAKVHYPIDVIVGSGVGIMVGLTTSTLYGKLLN